MSFRQIILKAFYPLLMLAGRLKRSSSVNKELIPPPFSFYNLQTTLNNGSILSFESLKGKKVLLVNTASNCGYTQQYAELQKLYERFQGNLVVIGFPANDFKQQEKGEDEAIAQFCQANFGVTFPLAKKSPVVKSAEQNPVFEWLCHKNKNGWNDQQPAWNFSKYLVNESGILTHYFDASVSPLSKEVIDATKRGM